MPAPLEQRTPKLTVIIPVLNAAELLSSTLAALHAGRCVPDELVVVDDVSSDGSAEVAHAHDARVLKMTHNSGPAACRNYAALQTIGDILIFLDADTRVHDDTVWLLAARLQSDPSLDAVIGAYDREPFEQGMCSQFHNLAHCYVHRSSARDAQTFWSGCGAIRRSAFLRAGGFDERYTRPSVEDIELGYRMTAQGARILLDPAIMVTHLKRWTLASAITTNIRDRGMPWMLLLLRGGRVPNDLNVTWRHRASVALTCMAFIGFSAGLMRPWCAVAGIACAALAIALQVRMLRFVCKGKSPLFAMGAVALCFLQEVCKVTAVVGGAVLLVASPAPSARRSSIPIGEQSTTMVNDSEKLPA